MLAVVNTFFYLPLFLKGWGLWQPEGQHGGLSEEPNDAAVERILKMDPKVECTVDSMKLKVHDNISTTGSLFFVDRGKYQSEESFICN